MEKKFREIQAEALLKLGRELNEQELQSYLDMKIMEEAFVNIDIVHPEDVKPAIPEPKD